MTFPYSREEALNSIENRQWDMLIIGGGITGAGILREAVRRGLKALLIDQKDFAWGTSSRSTKMVHGGLRYLKEGNLALTRESVKEREKLLKELPGLVESAVFVMPFYKGHLFGRLLMRLGLIVYDLLSGKEGKGRRHVCSVREMKTRAPLVDQSNLKGGFLIHDAVTDDARLVLRVLSEAVKQGGTAINYLRGESLIKTDDQVTGLMARDDVSGREYTLQAKVVVNATGAWADKLRGQVSKKNTDHIRPLRGSHLIIPADRLPLKDNVSLLHPKDGRPVLALKWEDRILMGTTDIDHGHQLDHEAAISPEETDYLLEALNYQFPDAGLSRKDVISTMAGIRPVIDTGKKDPSDESRDHVIWEEDGMLSVTGGKLTTFRIIALDVMKATQLRLGHLSELNDDHAVFETQATSQTPSLLSGNPEGSQRLLGRYGSFAESLVSESPPETLKPVSGLSTLWAELNWAASHEMVVHLDDLLLRRTRIGILLPRGAKDQLPEIRKICQQALSWDDQKWETEEKRYLEIWENFYAAPEL